MSDIGSKHTDKAINKLDKQLNAVYSEAAKDIEKKIEEFDKKYKAKESIYITRVKNGEMTQNDFDAWKQGQVFQGKQWQNKKDQILNTLYNTNKIAVDMVNSNTIGVFAFNANYAAYNLEHGAGVNFGFTLYDSKTVENLIKNNPQLLPKYKITEQKDYIWNGRKLDNAITQGIIQGESLKDINKRVAQALSSQNNNAMKTFAHTAMTGAQNAGRFERLSEAKAMGINVVKRWMATLDGRTRDSHAKIDGETQKVGDAFHQYLYKFSNGCRYPGDPLGPPHEVYNCRCTLVEDVLDYPDQYERYDNIDGKPIANMTYTEWLKIKSQSSELTEAQLKLASLQAKVDSIDDINKVFKGIWEDDITYADWDLKKDTIQSKRQYFEHLIQLEKDFLSSDPDLRPMLRQSHEDYLKKLEKYLNDLNEFEKYGEEYSKLLKDLKSAQKEVKDLTPKGEAFGPDAYSRERKDKAVWAKSKKEADNVLRGVSGEVWRNATDAEKSAIYEYTASYHKFNEPLRGIQYGTSKYLGVGKTDLNAGRTNNGERLNAITNIIDKSSYSEDIWLQRGCNLSGMDKFLDCSMSLLEDGSQSQLEDKLLGKVITEYGFMSCGSAKGQGFSNHSVIFNVYAPAGTKMMYVEPFSAFGDGAGLSWDGESKQSSFGGELETILQQGTQFRIAKVEKTPYGNLYFDIDVIAQDNVQLWEK